MLVDWGFAGSMSRALRLEKFEEICPRLLASIRPFIDVFVLYRAAVTRRFAK